MPSSFVVAMLARDMSFSIKPNYIEFIHWLRQCFIIVACQWAGVSSFPTLGCDRGLVATGIVLLLQVRSFIPKEILILGERTSPKLKLECIYFSCFRRVAHVRNTSVVIVILASRQKEVFTLTCRDTRESRSSACAARNSSVTLGLC